MCILKMDHLMNKTTPHFDDNGTNVTGIYLTWDKILTAVVLYSITLTTFVGNILVLVAVKAEKKLATSFNYYIVNLAITDASVAITAMSFKATHTVLGYWPFGEVVCAFWIFFDYGMTFVSVFTLIIISVDRFWCVAWSLHYKQHHSNRKCFISIVFVWLFMLVLWVPPCVLDRVRHSEPEKCFWDPNLNMELVFIVAILGHHAPCCIMLFCYVYVFVFMRNRSNIKQRKGSSVGNVVKTISLASTSEFVKLEEESACRTPTRELDVLKAKDSRELRDEKAYVTLTYIIVAYVILWTPFHVIFDISIAKPSLVPEAIWEVGFWMTYINSTVNPFIYAFSNEDFRKAFKKVLGIKQSPRLHVTQLV